MPAAEIEVTPALLRKTGRDDIALPRLAFATPHFRARFLNCWVSTVPWPGYLSALIRVYLRKSVSDFLLLYEKIFVHLGLASPRKLPAHSYS